MKKNKILTLLTACAAVFTLGACGGTSATETPATATPTETPTEAPTVTPEKTLAEKVADAMKALQTATTDKVNTFETGYDDMVSYLKEKGVLDASATPVDINKTAGYVKKYDGTYTDVVEVADKAYAYGDVYLLYWDLANGTHASAYVGAKNNGSIVVNGGQYTMNVTALSGAYAIAFKSVTDVQASTQYDSTVDADWTAYQTRYAEAVNAAKNAEGVKDKLAAFTAIDDTAVSLKDYMSCDELALELKNEKLISITDVASPTNLNQTVQYNTTKRDWVGYYNEETNPNGTETGYSEDYATTAYASYASSAYKYGKVSILYFDTLNGFDYYPNIGNIYNSLKETGKASLYEKVTRTADWTVIEGSEFSATLYGNFAIIVED